MKKLLKIRPYPEEPLRWYWAYRIILVLFALSNFGSLTEQCNIIKYGTWNYANITEKIGFFSFVIISVFELIAMIYLIINMPYFTKAVYNTNRILMYTEIIGCIALTFYNAYFFVTLLIRVPLYLLNLCYFKKRKHLFERYDSWNK